MSELPAEPSPWMPMSNPTDVKVIGKLLEELGECVSASARTLLQGIDEVEPTTRKPNRQWLSEEVADVLANITLAQQRFRLDREEIDARANRKMAFLKDWHAQTPDAEPRTIHPLLVQAERDALASVLLDMQAEGAVLRRALQDLTHAANNGPSERLFQAAKHATKVLEGPIVQPVAKSADEDVDHAALRAKHDAIASEVAKGVTAFLARRPEDAA